MHLSTMRKRRSSRSLSKLVPLKILPPTKGSNVCSSCRLLAVAQPTTTARTSSTKSHFKLPRCWRVKEVPRNNDPSHIDKYYFEPGTGRKFRSLKEVQRHVTGEEYTPTYRAKFWRNRSSRYRKMIVTNGKMLKLDEEVLNWNQLAIVASSRTANTSQYNLPDGWVVEEVPRTYDKSIDRYYYEPGTGRKFRSLTAVQRYLAELNEDRPLLETFEVSRENEPLSKMFKVDHHPKSSASSKEVTRENTQNLSFVNPPKTINWVISSPQGDAWIPFIGETLIPDSVKQQWIKRFTLLLNNGNDGAEDSRMQR